MYLYMLSITILTPYIVDLPNVSLNFNQVPYSEQIFDIQLLIMEFN